MFHSANPLPSIEAKEGFIESKITAKRRQKIQFIMVIQQERYWRPGGQVTSAGGSAVFNR